MQAKDIPDAEMLNAIRRNTTGLGGSLAFIQADFPDVPPKVVRAKLHALCRRDIINGCTCGCRGDFQIVGEDQPQTLTWNERIDHYERDGMAIDWDQSPHRWVPVETLPSFRERLARRA